MRFNFYFIQFDSILYQLFLWLFFFPVSIARSFACRFVCCVYWCFSLFPMPHLVFIAIYFSSDWFCVFRFHWRFFSLMGHRQYFYGLFVRFSSFHDWQRDETCHVSISKALANTNWPFCIILLTYLFLFVSFTVCRLKRCFMWCFGLCSDCVSYAVLCWGCVVHVCGVCFCFISKIISS